MSIPNLNHLFLLVTFFIFIYISIYYKKKIFDIFSIQLLKNYYLFLLILIPFIWGILISFELNYFPLSDLYNALGIILFILLFNLLFKDIDSYFKFQKYLIRTFFLFSLFSLFLGYLKISLLLFNIKINSFIHYHRLFSFSIVSDYNFYSLSVLIGLIISIFWFFHSKKKINSYLMGLYWFLVFIAIIFTGSRRAVFIFGIAEIFFLYHVLISIFKNKLRKQKYSSIGILFISQFIIILFLGYITFGFSDLAKDHFVKKTQKEHTEFRTAVSFNLSRLVNLFYTIPNQKVHNLLWMQERTDNSFSKNKLVQSIKSFNDEFYLKEGKYHIYNGDFNEGFQNWKKWGDAKLELGFNQKDNILKIISNNRHSGIENNLYVSKGDTITLCAKISVLKYSSTPRFIIKSYYPDEYAILKIPKLWENDNLWHTIKLKYIPKESQRLFFYLGGGDENVTKLLVKEVYIESKNCFTESKLTKSNINEYDFKVFEIEPIETTDILNPTRKYSNTEIIGGRHEKFKFGLVLFKDFNIKQKLFGNGFNYMSLYGKEFYPNENILDYPHNFLLSSLLYSGVIGFFCCLAYIFIVLYYFYSFRRQFSIFIILLILVTFFSVFSGNSIFSIPIFIFIIILPLLMKSTKYN